MRERRLSPFDVPFARNVSARLFYDDDQDVCQEYDILVGRYIVNEMQPEDREKILNITPELFEKLRQAVESKIDFMEGRFG